MKLKISRWSTDLDSLDVFDRHFYRALFQRVVIDFKLLGDIPEKDIIVGHLSHGSKKRGWLAYCKAIFRKWNVEGPNDEILEEYLNRYKHLRIQVSIIWTLRAMLGACLESLILYDRIMFLNEWSKRNQCQLDVQLKPIFDPILSPRNMALIVTKSACI
jgi:hypothetical protein